MNSATCKSCEIEKKIDNFPKDKSTKSGYRSVCEKYYKFNRFLNTSKNKFNDIFVGEFFACIDKYYQKI